MIDDVILICNWYTQYLLYFLDSPDKHPEPKVTNHSYHVPLVYTIWNTEIVIYYFQSHTAYLWKCRFCYTWRVRHQSGGLFQYRWILKYWYLLESIRHIWNIPILHNYFPFFSKFHWWIWYQQCKYNCQISSWKHYLLSEENVFKDVKFNMTTLLIIHQCTKFQFSSLYVTSKFHGLIDECCFLNLIRTWMMVLGIHALLSVLPELILLM